MGRASNRKNSLGKLKLEKALAAEKEGTIQVSFVFDGRVYVRNHQLSGSELKSMKQMLADHGDYTAQQLQWRMTFKNAAILAENITAEAARDYILRHHKEHKLDTDVGGVPTQEKVAEMVEELEQIQENQG